jgi:AcrR family transcriptional regulator
VVKDPEIRREEIVTAARELFAERGVRATTFQDVAERVGVTRGLVYHYATDMGTLVDQVLETCIAEFVTDLRAWDEAREVGNIDQAVIDCVGLFRRHVPTSRRTTSPGPTPSGTTARPGPTPSGTTTSPGPTPSGTTAGRRAERPLPRFDDASLYVRFLDRAVDALIDTLEVTTIPAYAQRHTIEIRHVRETFHVLIHGLVALVRSHPDVGDAVLGDLVRQTLRLAPNDPDVTPRRRPVPLEGE